jgi:hypothetical protein
MGISGHNGYNETFIGMSSLLSLSVFDQNMNEIEISQTQRPIELILKRDPKMADYSYKYINTTQIQISSSYLLNGFNLTSNNASVHIELMSFNVDIGYLVVMKLGYTPILNATFADFNAFKIFCPSKKIHFYLYLLRNTKRSILC